MVAWMDDRATIPGTGLRVGLDPLIGWILPGVGDALTTVCAASLLVYGLMRGVPTSVLLRMGGHLALDALVGSVPIVGDIFDAFYHANRRNLRLLEAAPKRAPGGVIDYLIVGAVGLLAVAVAALPILVGLYFARFLFAI